MKKLLLVFLSLAVVLGVQAQDKKFRSLEGQLPTVVSYNKAQKPLAQRVNKAFQGMPVSPEMLQAGRMGQSRMYVKGLSAKTMKKLPAQASDLYNTYVEDFTAETDVTNYMVSHGVEVSEAIYEDVPYIYFEGLCGGDAYVAGEYDPEDGTIVISRQICYEDPDYGKLGISGVTEISDESMSLGDLVLQVQEDELGTFITLGEGMAGWVIQLTQDIPEQGITAGEIWNFSTDLVLNVANYYETKYVVVSEDADWEEDEALPVFVEEIGDETLTNVAFHGFTGNGTVYADVDANGTATLPTGQMLAYHPTYGDICLYAWAREGNSIKLDYDIESIPVIMLRDGRILLAKETEVDEEAGTFKPDWAYFTLGLYGKGYFYPIMCDCLFVPREMYEEGVGTVLATPATAGKSYTIDGKLATDAVKGIKLSKGSKTLFN